MRGLSQTTKDLIRYGLRLLEQDHPQTLRQLHYAIFSRRKIEYDNTQSDYKRLSRATTHARRKYRQWGLGGCVGELPHDSIPPQWMVDETRQREGISVWDNAIEYVAAVKRSYRRDNWQDQPYYCEVWCEKGTVLSSIRPVTDEWGVKRRIIHGFSSTGMESDVGSLFEEINKEIVVFYLGDHDPSGRCIEDDIHRRAQVASGVEFQLVRLAIHEQDIAKFNLPSQKIKSTDSRARAFQKKVRPARRNCGVRRPSGC